MYTKDKSAGLGQPIKPRLLFERAARQKIVMRYFMAVAKISTGGR
jgi:hypothetical protein